MSFETFRKSQFFLRKSSNLQKLGFDFSGDPQQEYLKIQNLLMTRYFIENGSMITIMKEFGIPSSRTMDTVFREFEIKARSDQEAALLSIQEGRSDPFKNAHSFVHIWHDTWEGKNFMLRSSHEEHLAKFLDDAQIRYEVECMRIKYFDGENYRIAIPDFYLPETNEIVEVKSTYWLDKENMNAKSKAYKELGFGFLLYLDKQWVEW